MKVKDLRKWLEDKNDEDDICELDEYGFANSLLLEYFTIRKEDKKIKGETKC